MQRELLSSAQLLAHQVGPDAQGLANGHGHQRTSLGRPNRMVSVVVARSLSRNGAERRSVSMISSTSAAGAEAPAVRPIVDAPASQPSSMSEAPSISSAGSPARLRDLHQPDRVGGVRRARPRAPGRTGGDGPDGGLAVGGGVADVVAAGRGEPREPLAQRPRRSRRPRRWPAWSASGRRPRPPVRRPQRGRRPPAVWTRDTRSGRLAEGALDLLVAGVADQRDSVAVGGEPAGLGVHLGHERAGGVDHRQSPGGRPPGADRRATRRGRREPRWRRRAPRPAPRRRPRRGLQVGAPRGGCGRSACARRPARRALEGALDDLDGPLDAGAERAGRGQDAPRASPQAAAHRSSGRAQRRSEPRAARPPGPARTVAACRRRPGSPPAGCSGRAPRPRPTPCRRPGRPVAASVPARPAGQVVHGEETSGPGRTPQAARGAARRRRSAVPVGELRRTVGRPRSRAARCAMTEHRRAATAAGREAARRARRRADRASARPSLAAPSRPRRARAPRADPGADDDGGAADGRTGLDAAAAVRTRRARPWRRPSRSGPGPTPGRPAGTGGS